MEARAEIINNSTRREHFDISKINQFIKDTCSTIHT